jgi:hypothetical protein
MISRPESLGGVLEVVLSSASFLSCFVNTFASPYSHPGKGRGWLEVADPGLEEGKVAVLRPHSACHLAACICRIQVYTQMSSGEGLCTRNPQ